MRVAERLRTLPDLLTSRVVPHFKTPNILVVEGSQQFGPAFLKIIPKEDNACWIRRVSKTRPFTGIDLPWHYVFLNLDQCRIALIDGQIDGPITAAELIRALTDLYEGRIVCVGISWLEGVNEKLGVPFSIEKGPLLSALKVGMLSLSDFLHDSSDPESLHQKIKLIQERFRSEQAFRRQAGNIVADLLHGTHGGS